MANPLDKGAGEAQALVNLARNVVNLRSARQWTQGQLAKLAGLPRSTLTNIESGHSNPSLKTLLSLASALQVPLEEMLIAPETKFKHVPAENIPIVKKKGGVTVYGLLPDAITGMEMSRMEFAPSSHTLGVPHLPGTREYFTCVKGMVHVTIGTASHRLKAGDVLAFAGNQVHAYSNPAQAEAVGVSVVVFASKGV